jgi:hypothetical protein
VLAVAAHCRLRADGDADGVLLRIASEQTPALAGLAGRWWSRLGRTLRGTYLFDDEPQMDAFCADPSSDVALAWIEAVTASRVSFGPAQRVPPGHHLEAPTFILSSPRAGSTALFDALRRCTDAWTVAGEGKGMIEGVPALHPAALAFDSHRLDAAAATAPSQVAVRAGFLAAIEDRSARRWLDLAADERPERPRLLDKTPENSVRAPFLLATFPDARFIVLLRDGRATVSSLHQAWSHDGFVNLVSLPGGWPGGWHFLLPPGWRDLRELPPVQVAFAQWRETVEAMAATVASLPADRWVAIDFDTLTRAPTRAIEVLASFMGVETDAGAVRRLARGLPLSSTTITPPSRGKWRFDPGLTKDIEEALEPIESRLRTLCASNEVLPSGRPRRW